MTATDPDSEHAEDLPWNDVPADNDVMPGSLEPDPAEILGEDGAEYDAAAAPRVDPYHRDTLSERLAEERPELGLGTLPDAAAGELQDPGMGGGDVHLAEHDTEYGSFPGELAAEDAAVHIIQEEGGQDA